MGVLRTCRTGPTRFDLIAIGERLGLAVMLIPFLGTSRRLDSKELVGRVVELPAGVEATAPPPAFFGENVSNQGCVAPQRVDLAVALPLKNVTPSAIHVLVSRATMLVDGQSRSFPPGSWVVRGAVVSAKMPAVEIAPGTATTLWLRASALFREVASLTQVDRIEIEIPFQRGRARIVFDGVRAVPISRGHRRMHFWTPPIPQR